MYCLESIVALYCITSSVAQKVLINIWYYYAATKSINVKDARNSQVDFRYDAVQVLGRARLSDCDTACINERSKESKGCQYFNPHADVINVECENNALVSM